MDEATLASRQTWDAASAGWERNADLVARTSTAVTGWLIGHLQPRPGETFLELAAGPGDTGFEVARRIAPGGRLISTDIAPGMVEAAKRRAAAARITNVEFREMDAQHIELPDASVDGVVHRFGPMLLPDPPASAREARRVLRGGGRYATASWASMDENPVFPLLGRSLMEHGFIPPPPSPDDGTGPGGMASMSDHTKVRGILEDAGFTDITIENVPARLEYRGFDELWMLPSELAGPIAQVLRALDAGELDRAKDAIRTGAEPYLQEDGIYRFPAVTVCFIAR